MSNIRILIIEDEIIIAEDIAAMLTNLGYDVLEIIGHSQKAIDFLSENNPDLVLCDINIKGPNDGIQVVEFINNKKKIPFIYLTSLSDKDTLDRAKKTLPYGYIIKPFDEKDLLSAIEMALYKFHQEMEYYEITKAKLDSLITNSPLTDSEFEIVLLMIKGYNNEQIGKKLFISVNTVKYHIKKILDKFDALHRGDIMQKILLQWMGN
ncbi:MAG: response regulator transcription factor [Saprospiraceae bacterium]|nr:response regulator transcription factor [Saprospiraceae bacterium]